MLCCGFSLLITLIKGLVLYLLVIVIRWFWDNKEWIKIMMDKKKREIYFSNVVNEVAKEHNIKTREQKTNLFHQLHEISKEKGGLKVLEIGGGTGANLAFYPENTGLTVIEINEKSKELFMRNLEKYPNVHLDQYIVGDVKNYQDLIAPSSFDAVVTTLVCCSVGNEQGVYDCVKHALRPGGRYLYMEHIPVPSLTSWIHYAQFLWDWSGLWSFLYDGCHLTRHIDEHISDQTFFSQVDQKLFEIEILPQDHWAWKYVKQHVMGSAIREEGMKKEQ